jgi:hypothetical protein
MKPVVIIAIAVVCSVVAVLGVLVGLDQIATMQAQQAYDEYQIEQQANQIEEQIKYDENKQLCLTLFPDMGFDVEQQNEYLRCLDYGVEEALLYSCTKHGLDRINCMRILQEQAAKGGFVIFEDNTNP